MCKRNDGRLGIANGDRGAVARVRCDAGEFDISFDDGRTVALDRRFIHAGDEPSVVHGYACTAHVLQGATTDRAFVLGSELAYREWGYTAWSRACESTRYFVCEPALWDDEHHTSGRNRGASISDVVRTLERSRANDLALDAIEGPDPAVVSAVAARHLERPYVDAAMGERRRGRVRPGAGTMASCSSSAYVAHCTSTTRPDRSAASPAPSPISSPGGGAAENSNERAAASSVTFLITTEDANDDRQRIPRLATERGPAHDG
jgi:hypothetical protein